MVHEDKLCDSKDRPSFDLTWSVAVFSVVVPFTLALCALFSYKLRAQTTSNPLRTRVEAYNALVIIFILVGFYIFLIDPIRQRSHGLSIPMCCTLSWVIWFLPGATYLTLQNVFLQRLKIAFDGTVFGVSEKVIKIWNAFHVCCLLVIAVLLTIRNVFQVDCYIEREIRGAVMNRTVLWCSVKHSDYIQDFGIYSAVLVVIGGNLLLAYMYIWRLKAALFPDAIRRASNDHMNDEALGDLKVIRKSTVVAMASIVTSILGFIGTAFNLYLLTYVDVILNVIFLFSMFSFGNGVYNCLFGRCHFIVDCCMPKTAIELEKNMKRKQSQCLFVDASENSELPLGPRVLGGCRAKSATLVLKNQVPSESAFKKNGHIGSDILTID